MRAANAIEVQVAPVFGEGIKKVGCVLDVSEMLIKKWTAVGKCRLLCEFCVCCHYETPGLLQQKCEASTFSEYRRGFGSFRFRV